MIKQKTKKLVNFSTSYLAKLALLTALSFILYAFCKFPLPFIFPSFLDIQFSEFPALLAGFSMGPFSGCLVIVLKCIMKMPMSSTQYVGELTDIILGIAFVLPASLIYRIKKDKKHAIIGLTAGLLLVEIVSVLLNRFVSIPFYIEFFFGGNWQILLNMMRPLYPKVTKNNFYTYYLLLAIVPFNLLRSIITSSITFLVYKRISKLLHWEGTKINRPAISDIRHCHFISKSIEDTYYLAGKLAKTLSGGEVVLLNGELGAGKTTFTKGLAKALEIKEEVVSPTFIMMREYKGRLTLYHFDLYRITEESELEESGLKDLLFENGVCVIEWNKFTELPDKVIKISIKRINDTSRSIEIE